MYVLSCCTTCDLTAERLNARNIPFVAFHYELGGVTHTEDFGASMPLKQFYDEMAAGADTKTSQVNIGEFADFFRPFLEEGKDILHIAFSGGLSGTANSARNAAEMLKEEYPDCKIVIVDSLAASSGYGLVVDKAADLRDSGMGLEELAAWIEEHKLNCQHWFFSTTLKYFIRGGRISKTAGLVGEALGICPLMRVDPEGKLVVMEKVRTKRKVRAACAQKMFDLCENGADYADKCFISHSDCLEDAQAVAALIEEHCPNLKGKVEMFDIGTVIGSHTGPGTVALFFWGEKR
ncbi:MAG: DegV family protein [Clostridia bacterium]|nr:DegV family protein [Clostridia bacterium]